MLRSCVVLVAALLPSFLPLAVAAESGTALVVLNGSLPIRAPGLLFGEEYLTLHAATMQVREAIQSAEPTVALDLSQGLWAGPAACEEIAAILRERPDGKRVIACIDGLDDATLAIAAACDEVVVAEAGFGLVDGLALDAWYAADLLAKAGITVHAVTSGPAKTAPEVFTRNTPSPAAIEELQTLTTALDAAMSELALRPGLDAPRLAAARAVAPQTPALLVSTGLGASIADPGAWRAGLPQPVRHLADENEAPDLSSFSGIMAFWGRIMAESTRQQTGPRVAVVELAGEIMPGTAGDPGELICDGDTVELLDDLAEDEDVVAVVLRIDSPGGDAGASDRIHRAVRRLDAVKPVYALCDQIAASGGYYIACAARKILVHRTTITGSIGVFAVMPDVTGTTRLLGLHRHVITTAPRADLFGLGPFTADKEAALRQVIDDVDRRFQGLVAERRGLDAAAVEGLAGGRVYTGDQAVANALADGVSHLVAVVRMAREAAGHQAPLPIERLPRDGGLAAQLGLASSHGPASLIPSRIRAWAEVLGRGTPRILVRAPAIGAIR
jgi:protease IV